MRIFSRVWRPLSAALFSVLTAYSAPVVREVGDGPPGTLDLRVDVRFATCSCDSVGSMSIPSDNPPCLGAYEMLFSVSESASSSLSDGSPDPWLILSSVCIRVCNSFVSNLFSRRSACNACLFDATFMLALSCSNRNRRALAYSKF